MDKSDLTDDLRGPAEIKAACLVAVFDAWGNRLGDDGTESAVNAVLDTIIAHSQSPRTVDELVRIRGPISD